MCVCGKDRIRLRSDRRLLEFLGWRSGWRRGRRGRGKTWSCGEIFDARYHADNYRLPEWLMTGIGRAKQRGNGQPKMQIGG